MSNEKNGAEILIDLFLHNELQADQAEELLALLKSDSRLGRSLYNNIHLDLLLQELNKEREAVKIVEDDSFDANDPIKTLEELVAYEKNAIPIPSPVLSKEKELPEPKKSFFFFNKNNRHNPTATVLPRKYSKRSNLFFAIQLMILVGLVVGLSLSHHWEKKQNFSDENFNAIAQIEEIVAPVWAKGSPVFKRGQGLEAGNIALQSGMVKIRMSNQVRIILAGPVDFTLDHPMKTICRSGKATVHVPKEGEGFELATPFLSVLDRGTEFSVEVNQKEALVGVLKGNVDLNKNGEKIESLKEKDFFQIDLPGKAQRIAWIPDRFLSNDQFQSGLKKWTAHLTSIHTEKAVQWNRDPDLLVRFDFNDVQNSRVKNSALAGAESIPFGNIAGGSAAEGAIGNFKAIQFENSRDLFSWTLPGKERAITLFASVRIDRLDHVSNVLIASEQLYEKPGTILWQISNEGTVQFFINGSDGNRLAFHTDRILSKRLWNTWVNLAVVLDPDKKTVSHYLDGELKTSLPWNDPIILEPGSLMGGNQIIRNGARTRTENLRYFQGAFGQISIYKRALNAEEIKNLE
ncbi:MAG: LamG-like jellyroll fold domain-containing protein [Planctomycetia bacterium]|nr:LamG-like jellyroll fold domain-containing protein [Planctomycetia bacterium]